MKYVTVEWNGEKAGIISADPIRIPRIKIKKDSYKFIFKIKSPYNKLNNNKRIEIIM